MHLCGAPCWCAPCWHCQRCRYGLRADRRPAACTGLSPAPSHHKYEGCGAAAVFASLLCFQARRILLVNMMQNRGPGQSCSASICCLCLAASVKAACMRAAVAALHGRAEVGAAARAPHVLHVGRPAAAGARHHPEPPAGARLPSKAEDYNSGFRSLQGIQEGVAG